MPTVAMRIGEDEPFSTDGLASREDPDVVAGLVSALPDHALEFPSCVFREAREFLRRDQEQVKPIPDSSLVPDAEREESRRPAAADVPLHIREVILGPGPGDPAASDQMASFPHDPAKVPQESAKARDVSGKAEVVAEHEDGVEGPESAGQPVHARGIDVREAPDTREGDLGRRGVDPDDVEPSLLEDERVPSGSAPEVEDPAADEADRLPLHPRPLARRGEVALDLRGPSIPVVPLELDRDLLPEPVVEHRAGVQLERRSWGGPTGGFRHAEAVMRTLHLDGCLAGP